MGLSMTDQDWLGVANFLAIPMVVLIAASVYRRVMLKRASGQKVIWLLILTNSILIASIYQSTDASGVGGLDGALPIIILAALLFFACALVQWAIVQFILGILRFSDD